MFHAKGFAHSDCLDFAFPGDPSLPCTGGRDEGFVHDQSANVTTLLASCQNNYEQIFDSIVP